MINNFYTGVITVSITITFSLSVDVSQDGDGFGGTTKDRDFVQAGRGEHALSAANRAKALR